MHQTDRHDQHIVLTSSLSFKFRHLVCEVCSGTVRWGLRGEPRSSKSSRELLSRFSCKFWRRVFKHDCFEKHKLDPNIIPRGQGRRAKRARQQGVADQEELGDDEDEGAHDDNDDDDAE